MRDDDRRPASLSFTRWHACFLFSGFCHFAENAHVGIRLEQHSGFFGWPSRCLLKVTDVWSLTLHTLQSVLLLFPVRSNALFFPIIKQENRISKAPGSGTIRMA